MLRPFFGVPRLAAREVRIVDVHLIAVQAKMAPAHYRTAGAFRNKILELTERATAGLDDAPKLVAFPETIGFPLLLALGEELPPFATVREAVLFHFRRSWRDLVRLMLTCGLTPWQALYRMRALDAFLTYRDVMSEAALSSGVTIVAGTSFLPDMDEEPSRGLHVTGRRTYNVAYTFGPTGSILSRTRKINLAAGAESRAGLSRGPADDVRAFLTPVGSVGVAVCLDGFYRSVLDRLDGEGAQVVVQPSANHASWERPWPADGRLREGEAWLQRGLRAQIQDRLSIRYGVNPMMVGDLWDLQARGRSSLVGNRRYVRAACEGYAGVLALARTSDQEEVVRARVSLPAMHMI